MFAMKKVMVGIIICVLVLGSVGCGKDNEQVRVKETKIKEETQDDALHKESDNSGQLEETDSEDDKIDDTDDSQLTKDSELQSEGEEEPLQGVAENTDKVSGEQETPEKEQGMVSEPSVEPVYFAGDEMEVREQKLQMAKDNPYRKVADDYFEQVLEVGGPNNYLHLFQTDTVYYTAKDFENCSEKLLKLAKNEIYARHGRMFVDADLYEYFLTRMWYVPTYTPEEFDESCFNDCEKANLKLLLSLGA